FSRLPDVLCVRWIGAYPIKLWRYLSPGPVRLPYDIRRFFCIRSPHKIFGHDFHLVLSGYRMIYVAFSVYVLPIKSLAMTSTSCWPGSRLLGRRALQRWVEETGNDGR